VFDNVFTGKGKLVRDFKKEKLRSCSYFCRFMNNNIQLTGVKIILRTLDLPIGLVCHRASFSSLAPEVRLIVEVIK
jgi:hypothetical protein